MVPEVPWWRSTTVYQIYPRSFADSNGDGIGDLPGILGRLDYLQELGVETLWLSPVFRSPQQDFGYDISDFYDVAPEYGTQEDLRALIGAIHSRGMRVVLDMVLNHTSEQHSWFQQSRQSRNSPLRDFYTWREGRGPGGRRPPNNWRSVLGPSGWHHDAATGQWYWTSFLPFQPDLNYRNPAVRHAMLDVVRHWLAQGVDGLRLDLFNALFKDSGFQDNPACLRPLPTEDNPNGFFQRCVHTIDHPDTLAFARELRAVVDQAPAPPRFLVGEVFGAPAELRRYCGERADGLHLVFLFKTLRTAFSAGAFRALLAEYEATFPDPYLPTWVLGNHDRPRLSCRIGEDADKARLLATLQLTARGVPFVYYGEEIGLPHQDIPLAVAQDPLGQRFRWVPQQLVRWLRRRGVLLNRDECRAPMPWDGGPHAGFTTPGARPWLPLHQRSATLHVAAQVADPASVLSCYRRLLRVRRQCAALQAGALELVPAVELPKHVLGYRRMAAGQVVQVYLNFAAHPLTLRAGRMDAMKQPWRLVFSTHADREGDTRPPERLRPHEGIILAV